MSDEWTLWKCKNKHVLGQVTRNKYGEVRLLVYSRALTMEKALAWISSGHRQPFINIEVAGDAVVECSICGAQRRWLMSDEVIRRIMSERMAVVLMEVERLRKANGI
jgi:hypothetical protein